jgi:hypothetical protein
MLYSLVLIKGMEPGDLLSNHREEAVSLVVAEIEDSILHPPISAEEAHNLGIINHLVSKERLEEFTRDIANQITSYAPLAIRTLEEESRLLSKGHSLDSEAFEKNPGNTQACVR